MRTQALLEQMRVNTLQMFNDQQQLASGKRLLLPSDDPSAAAQALRLSDVLTRYTQLQQNAGFANNFNAATDTALSDIRDAVNQASTLASQNAGSLVTSDERAAAATVVDGLISQVLGIANRQQQGVYLFAGQQTDRPPFVDALGGILYQGDTNDLKLDTDGTKPKAVNLRGDQVFGGLSAEVRGTPIMPRVDTMTLLSDLGGATGAGLDRGSFVITEAGGAGSFTVDLSGTGTLGDVVAAINNAAAAAGAGVTASLSTYGISLSDGSGLAFSVSEQGSGLTAANLGITRATPSTDPIDGRDLQPKLTLTTPIAWLAGGSGIDTASGLTLSNGGQSVTVDLTSATTVQDILNAINNTNLGVMAKINDSATGIDVLSRLSGSNLSIGENGGTTAANLGIRSFRTDTKISSLNDGQGMGTVAGDDIRITAKDGTTVDVDLDGCGTIQDVLDKINGAAATAGVSVAAQLATVGNGIRLVDTTGGAGPFSVEALNYSQAGADLGLVKQTDGNELVGDDVNPIRSNGVFTVLKDLHTALTANDTQGITRAGEQLSKLLQGLAGWQGQIGAMGKVLNSQSSQLGEAALSAKTMLSDAQDADLTETITRFTQAQTTLQANLMTGSKLMQLSLLDFLQ